MSKVCTESRRRCWICWSWSYRRLWATMKALGIEPKSSGRVPSAFNHWSLPLALYFLFMKVRMGCRDDPMNTNSSCTNLISVPGTHTRSQMWWCTPANLALFRTTWKFTGQPRLEYTKPIRQPHLNKVDGESWLSKVVFCFLSSHIQWGIHAPILLQITHTHTPSKYIFNYFLTV